MKIPKGPSFRIEWFLGAVFTAFVAILVITYAITKQTHPIFLDQDGHPTNAIESK